MEWHQRHIQGAQTLQGTVQGVQVSDGEQDQVRVLRWWWKGSGGLDGGVNRLDGLLGQRQVAADKDVDVGFVVVNLQVRGHGDGLQG